MIAVAEPPASGWEDLLPAIGVTATVISAIVALLAAYAAMKSAKAAAESSAVSRHASLLGAIPLAVPWLEKDGGLINNRGKAAAFNLRWKILDSTDNELADGDRADVLRPGPTNHEMYSPAEALATKIKVARSKGDLWIVCEFDSPWGESFSVIREIRGKRNGRIRVYDDQGREIRISA